MLEIIADTGTIVLLSASNAYAARTAALSTFWLPASMWKGMIGISCGAALLARQSARPLDVS